MASESVGIFILWVVTLTWTLINTLALKDAIFEYHDEKQDNGFTDLYGTEELSFIAKKRLRQAVWFILGFSMMELIGLSALLRLVLYPPPPDNSLYANFSRVVIIIGVFGFWRAKRIARVVRRGFRKLFMPQGQGQGGPQSVPKANLTRKAEHIEQLAEDTNYKVNSINQKISPASLESEDQERKEDKE